MPRKVAVWDWGDLRAPSDGPCVTCGIEVSRTSPGDLGPAILALLPRWTAALMRPGVGCAAEPSAWSILEHGVHIRDVLSAVAGRLGGLLHADDPLLKEWDRDARANPAGGVDPMRVAVELDDAGRAVAARLGALDPGRVPPPGAGASETPATVLGLGRRLVHEVVHHLHHVNAWQTTDDWVVRHSSYPQNLSTGL